jgi:hypothetical protein
MPRLRTLLSLQVMLLSPCSISTGLAWKSCQPPSRGQAHAWRLLGDVAVFVSPDGLSRHTMACSRGACRASAAGWGRALGFDPQATGFAEDSPSVDDPAMRLKRRLFGVHWWRWCGSPLSRCGAGTQARASPSLRPGSLARSPARPNPPALPGNARPPPLAPEAGSPSQPRRLPCSRSYTAL